jgi:2-methylcitrate dehydratase PrpD
VEIVTRSGERISSPSVPYHLGHWKNPMNLEQIEAKFRSMSLGVLGSARTDALLERLWALEQVADIGEIIAAATAES